jgi:hypothetical protein
VLVAGIIVVLLSALADSLGPGRSPGFGWKRALGVIIGLLVMLVGYRWRRD